MTKYYFQRIGYAIAHRLAREGAKVIISSRKAKNVEEATQKLTTEGLDVTGLICHVAKAEDRAKLFEEVFKHIFFIQIFLIHYYF